MHDAKQTLLSRLAVGDTILAAPATKPGTFGYGRPKDPGAKPCEVTAIDTVPDQWTGKIYTVLLADGRKSDGRYGTTHVYVTPPAKPAKKKADASTGADAPATPIVPTEKFAPEVDLDLAVSGTRRVLVDPDGTMRVKDWSGGEVTERTPKGRLVHITADGVMTLIEDFPEDDEDEGMSEAEAQEVVNSDRCGQCKGFGVVRKRGSQAGKNYRTLNGAESATANGNSVKCPVCKGAALILRTA